MSRAAKAKGFLEAHGIEMGAPFDSLDPVQRTAVVAEAAMTFKAKHGVEMDEGNVNFVRKRYSILQFRMEQGVKAVRKMSNAELQCELGRCRLTLRNRELEPMSVTFYRTRRDHVKTELEKRGERSF